MRLVRRSRKRKQRRFEILLWIDKIAAAFFWFVKTVLLLVVVSSLLLSVFTALGV